MFACVFIFFIMKTNYILFGIGDLYMRNCSYYSTIVVIVKFSFIAFNGRFGTTFISI
jgi:hypothetical protein